MALTGTDRGTGTNVTFGTSLAILPPQSFTAGNVAVLCLVYDNTGTNGADPFSSISDTGGNTWNTAQAALYDPGAADAGTTSRIFWCHVVNLTTSITVTVSFGAFSVGAKVWAFHEISTNTSGRVVGFVKGAAGTGAASAAPTVTTGSIANGNMVIGVGAAENGSAGWVGDADTTNGTWSAQQAVSIGTAAAGQSITTQRKIVTATATQTYNPTLTSSDQILSWAEFAEVATARRLGLMGVG